MVFSSSHFIHSLHVDNHFALRIPENLITIFVLLVAYRAGLPRFVLRGSPQNPDPRSDHSGLVFGVGSTF